MTSSLAAAGASSALRVGTGWRVRTQQDIDRRRLRLNSQGVPFYQPRRDTQYTWMNIHRAFKPDARKFLQSKEAKALREASTGSSSNHFRDASRRALHAGTISLATREGDLRLNGQANQAKHRTTSEQRKWAHSRLEGSFADRGAAAMNSTTALNSTTTSFAAIGASSGISSAWADAIDEESDNEHDAGDLEISMPTDLDRASSVVSGCAERDTSSRVSGGRTAGAKSELAQKLDMAHKKHVEQKGTRHELSGTCSDFDFGYLQTFYLPRVSVEANVSMQTRLSALEDQIRRGNEIIAALEKDNLLLNTQVASLNTQIDMKSQMLGYHFTQSFQHYPIACDCRLGGCHLDSSISCDGNGQLQDLSGGFSPYVPLSAFDLSKDPSRIESRAVADDSAVVQPSLEEIRSELHGSFQTLRNELFDVVQSHVDKSFRTLRDDLFTEHGQVLDCSDTRAVGPHSEGHSAMTGQPVSLDTGNVMTGTCQPCTSDLLARFAALQNKKQKDNQEADEEKADKKIDKSDKVEDTIAVNIDTRAEGPHSDGHSAMTGQPVSSYAGNVMTGTLRDKDLKRKKESEEANLDHLPAGSSAGRLAAAAVDKPGIDDASLSIVPQVDMGNYRSNSVLLEETGMNFSDSDDGLSSHSSENEDGHSETQSEALARTTLEEGYDPYDIESPIRTDDEYERFAVPSDDEPWS